jgi:soluble lytic murein transglycosylase
MQQHPDYLPVAYPRAYAEEIRGPAVQSALAPELLYAVIRSETVFNPAAESSRAALGLFQFIPSTFAALNAQWKLVPPGDPRAAESFLLSPDTNILLGARWFRELLSREGGNVLFALMAHNAGPGAVGRWKSIWARLRRLDDYEFVVDTVPYEETRGFARRALTALWIAGATPEGSPFKPSQSERGNTVR